MQTLLEVLAEIRRLGDREALRFYNGFRTWKLTYHDLYRQIGAFVAYLDRSGLKKGDRVIVWAENRPEWVSVFWACVARGVQVVPVDYRSSVDLVRRIQDEVGARLIVTGDGMQPQGLDIAQFSAPGLADLAGDENFTGSEISPDDIVEIVYTSGTTGDPMGVVHRQKNICANLTPIQDEMHKYEKWARPFQPVRILDMLPLSHLFGQSLGIFIPPLLGGGAVFMLELHAGAILAAIHRERVSVLVSVPKLLINLQHEVERKFHPSGVAKLHGIPGILERWWRYRRVHSGLGFKFWALIVGGAEVNPEVEAFWTRLGFLVIQGYGLTETSPVVALNHPFNARSGSIGKPLPGQEVRIAPDGEILVRGASVIHEYLGTGTQAEGRVEDGWLHTGDIGQFDAEGRLYYKGRKKEAIVTSEGLNVYPQDVERVLNSIPEVKESAVVAARRGAEEQVHAALILRDPSADPAAVIAEANRRLESHQRIQSWSLWPEEDFPRTPSTMKVKRGEVARRIAQGITRGQYDRVGSILARLKGGEAPRSGELGVSSLERVELLSELENQYGVELDEGRFAEISSVEELNALVRNAGEQTARVDRALLPRWTRRYPARAFRFLFFQAVMIPLFRGLLTLTVEGAENLRDLQPPVLFAANHQSDLDTPAIFTALPLQWRYRVTPAMSQDYFRAWLEPGRASFRERTGTMIEYFLATGLFNAYPLPQRMAGVRRALKYTGELIDEGYCPLVYPEGTRTPDGTLQPFKTGIGLMATRLRVPVVPIRLSGLFEIYPASASWPKRGPVQVRIGPPLHLEQEHDEETATRKIETAVHQLKPGSSG